MGRWQLVHQVTTSTLPNWTGGSQEPTVHLNGDQLILPGALPTLAGPITVGLTWTRAD